MNGDKFTLLHTPRSEIRKNESVQLLIRCGLRLMDNAQLKQQEGINITGLLLFQESEAQLIPEMLNKQCVSPFPVLLSGEFTRGFADKLQSQYAEKIEVIRLILLANGERVVIGGDVDGKWVTYFRQSFANHQVISLICRRIEADEVAVHLPIFLLWKKSFYERLGESCDQSSASLPVVAQALGMDKRVGQWWVQKTTPDTDPYLSAWLRKQFKFLLEKTNINTIAIWGELSAESLVSFIDQEEITVRIYSPQASEMPNELNSRSSFCSSPEATLIGADLLIILQADELLKQFHLDTLKKRMSQPIVLDACFCFPFQEAEDYGIIYRTYGQKTNVWEWN